MTFSFQRRRISQLNIAYLIMTDCEKDEKMFLFNQVFKRNRHGEFRVTIIFLTFKVALNLVSHYFVFLVLLLGMFSHIQYMQSSSLIFRKCSKYFKCSNLLPTTLEQKRTLWLWSVWFQIVNSVLWLSSMKNVTLLSYAYNTGFGTKILDTSTFA